MKTTIKTLNQPELSAGNILAEITFSKIFGEKKDYFIDYKYEKIKHYYGRHCLDIGAGNGDFSRFLKSNNHHVTSLDVVNKAKESYANHITLFNGKDIPFDKKSFDTSILMFVLHHTNWQKQLIQDCIRVTKKYIIIAEDIIHNTFDSWMGAIHLNSSPWAKGNDSFKSHRGWLDFFSENNLEILECVEIPRWTYPVYPVARYVYVLKVI